MPFNLGDRVKVSTTIDQDKEYRSRGLASRYGHVVIIVDESVVDVEFHDFVATIPTRYLTLVEAVK